MLFVCQPRLVLIWQRQPSYVHRFFAETLFPFKIFQMGMFLAWIYDLLFYDGLFAMSLRYWNGFHEIVFCVLSVSYLNYWNTGCLQWKLDKCHSVKQKLWLVSESFLTINVISVHMKFSKTPIIHYISHKHFKKLNSTSVDGGLHSYIVYYCQLNEKSWKKNTKQ